jgi:PhnB protein
MTRAIPEDLPLITPHLVVKDAARAIQFYVDALGCIELYRVTGPDEKRIAFAELLLGSSRFFLVDEFAEQNALSPLTLGGTPVARERAVQAGYI